MVGVDAALVLVGSLGAALPVMALAGGIAFTADGMVNALTTHMASNGETSNQNMSISFWVVHSTYFLLVKVENNK